MQVRIIVFDKPQKWGKGNLQVFKVSEHLTLNGAKEKADELENKLKNISSYSSSLPILDFLADKKKGSDENSDYYVGKFLNEADLAS